MLVAKPGPSHLLGAVPHSWGHPASVAFILIFTWGLLCPMLLCGAGLGLTLQPCEAAPVPQPAGSQGDRHAESEFLCPGSPLCLHIWKLLCRVTQVSGDEPPFVPDLDLAVVKGHLASSACPRSNWKPLKKKAWPSFPQYRARTEPLQRKASGLVEPIPQVGSCHRLLRAHRKLGSQSLAGTLRTVRQQGRAAVLHSYSSHLPNGFGAALYLGLTLCLPETPELFAGDLT